MFRVSRSDVEFAIAVVLTCVAAAAYPRWWWVTIALLAVNFMARSAINGVFENRDRHLPPTNQADQMRAALNKFERHPANFHLVELTEEEIQCLTVVLNFAVVRELTNDRVAQLRPLLERLRLLAIAFKDR
jgi:hypothetical protein